MNNKYETWLDHLGDVPNFHQQVGVFYDTWGWNWIANGGSSANTPTATFEELLDRCKTAIAAIMEKIKAL